MVYNPIFEVTLLPGDAERAASSARQRRIHLARVKPRTKTSNEGNGWCLVVSDYENKGLRAP